LSDVCLSRTPRTERPRKTEIGTEVAHVTRDSDTTFKVKRSRSPDRFTHRSLNASGSCSGERGNELGVGNYCYVAVCSAALGASAPTQGGSRVAGHIVAAACVQLVDYWCEFSARPDALYIVDVEIRLFRITYWLSYRLNMDNMSILFSRLVL